MGDDLILNAFESCYRGEVDVLASLLGSLAGELDDWDEDVAWTAEGCVVIACMYGRERVIDLIVQDKRLNVDFNGYVFDAELLSGTSLQELVDDNRIFASYCPMVSAVYFGHLSTVKKLLPMIDPTKCVYGELGAEEFGSWQELPLLSFAAVMNCVELVDLLLQDRDRVDPSFDDCQALSVAADKGHAEIVKMLLQDKERVTPISVGNSCPVHVSALDFACRSGSVETVKAFLEDPRVVQLLQSGAPVNSACQAEGCFEVLKILLQNADTVVLYNVAAFLCIENKIFNSICLLMAQEDFDPNVKNAEGVGLFAYAVSQGDTKTALKMLELNSLVLEEHEVSESLEVCARNSYLQVLQQLVLKFVVNSSTGNAPLPRPGG